MHRPHLFFVLVLIGLAPATAQTPVRAVLEHYDIRTTSTCNNTNSLQVGFNPSQTGVASVTRTCTGASSTASLTVTAPPELAGEEIANLPSGPRYFFTTPILVKATIAAQLTYPDAQAYVAVVIPFNDTTASSGQFSGGKCIDGGGTVLQNFTGSVSITKAQDCERNPNFTSNNVFTDAGVKRIRVYTRGGASLISTSSQSAERPNLGFEVEAVYRIVPSPGPCPFRVQSVVGEVAYKKNGGGEWLPLTVGHQLCIADEFFTGVESGMVISGFDGGLVLKVEELTQYVLPPPDPTSLRDLGVAIKLGAVAASVKREKVVDTNFETTMPTATASVRGTIFSVKYDDISKASIISVEEGEVVVTGAKAPFPPTSPPGLPLTLRAGQRVRVTAEAVGPVSPNPALDLGGVVDSASYRPVVARGGIASVFGTNLAPSQISATTVPLPLKLGGTSVKVDGVLAPLFFVSPGLVNFQVPMTVPLNGETQVVVENDGAPSLSQKVATQSYAPSIFTFPTAADPIVVHLDGSLVSPQSPAERGESIVVFATGIGDLVNPPKTNQPALVDPLAVSRVAPTVTIGGVAAEVQFTGLTPGFMGLIQINIKVLNGTPSGKVPFVMSYGSSTSQPGLLLPVR